MSLNRLLTSWPCSSRAHKQNMSSPCIKPMPCTHLFSAFRAELFLFSPPASMPIEVVGKYVRVAFIIVWLPGIFQLRVTASVSSSLLFHLMGWSDRSDCSEPIVRVNAIRRVSQRMLLNLAFALLQTLSLSLVHDRWDASLVHFPGSRDRNASNNNKEKAFINCKAPIFVS